MAGHPNYNASSNGLRRAWGELFREWRAWCRHHRGVRRARKQRPPGDRLNVGCGKYKLAGWVNTDLFSAADLTFDIRETWPIEEGVFSIVRLEPVLEHVGYPTDALHVLTECYRVLHPDGVIRIGVPDTEIVLRAYIKGPKADYFQLARQNWHPPEVRLPMEHVNFHFRDRYDEHKFAYDTETLQVLLQNAGFTDVQPASFEPEFDQKDREAGTLRLQGRKPIPMETNS